MPPHPATSEAALHPGEALLIAARRGDDEAVLQAGCRIAVADPLLAAMCGEQIVKAILRCNRRAMPALAFVLREIALRRGGTSCALTMHMLFRMPRDACGIKVMSVMAVAGFDLTGCRYVPCDVRCLRDHHAHLARVHPGEMPEVCALLSRPSIRPFHGQSYGRFPGDLMLWRPFVHGRWGVPWAWLPTLLVVALAVAAVWLLGQGMGG